MSSDLAPHEVAGLDELEWVQRVYRPGQVQLTARAVITGLLLGSVMSFANVYIGLRTGWFFGMALGACLASFAVWRLLAAARIVRSELSMLETNCMQSTASAAAYATGNMVVGVIPAMLLLSVSPAQPGGTQLHWAALASWIACIAALGVTLAIPLKRQLIDRERLAFPSGTAAAVMSHGLFRGAREVGSRTRVLVISIVAGAVLTVLRDLRAIAIVPASSRLFDWLPRVSVGGVAHPMGDLGLVLDHSVLLLGAGVFAGLRTSTWMLVGGLVTAFVVGPIAISGGFAAPDQLARSWADFGIWLGAPLLVVYALVALVANWRAFVRTFASRGRPQAARMGIDLPLAWFWIGLGVFGGGAVVLGNVLFGISLLLGVVAVALSLVFGMVACRITGETDINPGGPMGKLTQLAFGMLRPQSPSTNLMTAAMTHASSTAAADLLNDLKSGHLLGADPRRQFAAQALGIFAGTASSVTAYFLLVPDAGALTGPHPQFAAPAAHQFQAISLLLQHGLSELDVLQRSLVVIGAIAGAAISVVERVMPGRARRYLPSAAGLGLGLLLPLSTSLSMALGAAVAAGLSYRRPTFGERVVWPASAGLLAGESLAGVVVTVLNQVV